MNNQKTESFINQNGNLLPLDVTDPFGLSDYIMSTKSASKERSKIKRGQGFLRRNCKAR